MAEKRCSVHVESCVTAFAVDGRPIGVANCAAVDIFVCGEHLASYNANGLRVHNKCVNAKPFSPGRASELFPPFDTEVFKVLIEYGYPTDAHALRARMSHEKTLRDVIRAALAGG